VIAKVMAIASAWARTWRSTATSSSAATDARIGFPAARAIGSPANHMCSICAAAMGQADADDGDVLSGTDAARVGVALEAYPPDQLDAEVDRLAKRIALMPSDLQRPTANRQPRLEMMGWTTMQRLAAENDVRAHLTAPYKQFFDTGKTQGFQAALRERDDPYGDLTGDTRGRQRRQAQHPWDAPRT